MEELDAQVDQDRKVLGKKPFDRDDEDHMGGGMTKRMHSTSDPESGQQSREGKPDGFHYSEHRTVDSKRNVIVNVHIEPANLNDVTPLPEILDEIQVRLGKLPKYMGLDAGYHNTWIAHLLEKKGIRVSLATGHTHKTPTYGKYRFKYDSYFDAYICPEHKHLYWKTTTARAIANTSVTAKPMESAHDGQSALASMTRRMVERHVWQDALDDVIAFTKSEQGRRIYSWRKETIERSFAEAKVNHGLRYARMLGIRNMREQSFLTAAVQNIKRLVASSFSLLLRLIARLPLLETEPAPQKMARAFDIALFREILRQPVALEGLIRKHSDEGGDDRFGQHIAAVVNQGIKRGYQAHFIGSDHTPNDPTGKKMANETQRKGEHDAHYDGSKVVFNDAIETGRKADDRKGKNIVQQEHAYRQYKTIPSRKPYPAANCTLLTPRMSCSTLYTNAVNRPHLVP